MGHGTLNIKGRRKSGRVDRRSHRCSKERLGRLGDEASVDSDLARVGVGVLDLLSWSIHGRDPGVRFRPYVYVFLL